MTEESLQEWLDRVTANTSPDSVAESNKSLVGAEQRKPDRPPWVVEYADTRHADKVFCSQCKSVYYISINMLSSSQLHYDILYSRFSNEIYMYTGWHKTNDAFRDALKHYLEAYPMLFFCPHLQEERSVHLFDICPCCDAYIPDENWSKVRGSHKIPYLELPPSVTTQNQPPEESSWIKKVLRTFTGDNK